MNIDDFKIVIKRIFKKLIVMLLVKGEILLAAIKNKTFQMSKSKNEKKLSEIKCKIQIYIRNKKKHI